MNAKLYELTTKPRAPSSVAAAVMGEVEELLGVPPAKKAKVDDLPPLGTAEEDNDAEENGGEGPVVGV